MQIPKALASEVVLDRAAALTPTMSPTDNVLAQHRLAALPGVEQPDRNRQIFVWAKDVLVSVPDDDAERLWTLADLRKSSQVWEHERGHERSVPPHPVNDPEDGSARFSPRGKYPD